jgi:hypothetical protein
MTSKTASDNSEEDYASYSSSHIGSDSDSDQVKRNDNVPCHYHSLEPLEPQHPWYLYVKYRKEELKKNKLAATDSCVVDAAAAAYDDDFDYGSDGDAEVMELPDQLRYSKKRPDLADSERVDIKRLKGAYDAVESQAWIGGTLEEINEVVLAFFHLEQCV